MAKEPERANRTVVAQGGFCLVERCDCGAIYLGIGPVTVKLDPSALPELAATVARAAHLMGLPPQLRRRPANANEVSAACPGEATAKEGEGEEGSDDRSNADGEPWRPN